MTRAWSPIEMTITCDECGMASNFSGPDGHECHAQACRQGWKSEHPNDICKFCVEKRDTNEVMAYHKRNGTCPF